MALVAVFAVVGPDRAAPGRLRLALGPSRGGAGHRLRRQRRRALGAGDAKFAAAMAPFIAREDVVLFATCSPPCCWPASPPTASPAASRRSARDTPDWESWAAQGFPDGTVPRRGAGVLSASGRLPDNSADRFGQHLRAAKSARRRHALLRWSPGAAACQLPVKRIFGLLSSSSFLSLVLGSLVTPCHEAKFPIHASAKVNKPLPVSRHRTGPIHSRRARTSRCAAPR